MGTVDLEKFRVEIDALDQQIIELIGRRIQVCRHVAEYKKKFDIPMMQPSRVNQVIERSIKQGESFSLSATLMRNIYKEIIAEACRVEDEIIDEAH